jgi:hypothetical protein
MQSLLLLVLLFVVAVSCRELTCPQGKVILYKFQSKANSFGGHGEAADNTKQRNAITADVGVVCAKEFVDDKGKKSFLMLLTFDAVEATEGEPDKTWKAERAPSKAGQKTIKDMNALFQKKTGIIISSDGQILKV